MTTDLLKISTKDKQQKQLTVDFLKLRRSPNKFLRNIAEIIISKKEHSFIPETNLYDDSSSEDMGISVTE